MRSRRDGVNSAPAEEGRPRQAGFARPIRVRKVIATSEPQVPQVLDLFAPVIAASGGARFADELIAALDRIVRVDHLCLMRFDARTRPPSLESATLRGGEHVSEIQRAYLGGHFRTDPSLRVPESSRFRDGVAILRLHRDAAARGTFGAQYYERVRLLERLTIASIGDGRLHCLNLYRHDEAGRFDDEEFELIEAIARFVAIAAMKHDEARDPRSRYRDRWGRLAGFLSLLRSAHPGLTGRERDVLARILVGMTSEGIALDLGIGVNSVLTYRKRAYGRLGITSQAQLFSLCLGYGNEPPPCPNRL